MSAALPNESIAALLSDAAVLIDHSHVEAPEVFAATAPASGQSRGGFALSRSKWPLRLFAGLLSRRGASRAASWGS
jgi:hypothetical protein